MMRSDDARSSLNLSMSIEWIRRKEWFDGGGRGMGVIFR